MDIAFIAKRYDTVGGTERDLYHLTELLASYGHKISVYCQEIRTSPPSGVNIKHVFSPPGRTSKLWSLAVIGPKMAYAGGHDLVIAFTRVLGQDIIRCGGGTHRIYLERMSQAATPIKRLFRRLSPYHLSLLTIEKKQLGYLDSKVLAISEVVKKEMMEVYGVSGKRIKVIYDGIDTALFHPDKKKIYRESIRSQFGIPQDAILVLFLGNGFKRKGLDLLLEAFPRLRDKGFFCLVVGGDAGMNSYMKMAKELGISGLVVFAGPQKGPERFYAAADIFVLPSLQEAFGNAVLEAMASGIPAITSKVAGASEILRDGLERYILEDPSDANSLASLISSLSDTRLRETINEKARKSAEGYSMEANAWAIEKLCLDLIKEKKDVNPS